MDADTKRGAPLGLGVWHGKGYYKALDLDGLRALLAAQGLHVVTAAEKTVLDAMAEVPYHCLKRQLNSNHRDEREAAAAELARREAAK